MRDESEERAHVYESQFDIPREIPKSFGNSAEQSRDTSRSIMHL